MLRLTLTLLALAALTACGPRPKAYGPIPDEARALEVAREILGDQVDQRSLKVSSERGAWIVRAATTVGTATLRLDAKTGRMEYDEVVQVTLIKPVEK